MTFYFLSDVKSYRTHAYSRYKHMNRFLQVAQALTGKATAGSPTGACEGIAQFVVCPCEQSAWPEEHLLYPYIALACNVLPESENRCVEAGYLKNMSKKQNK